LFFSWAEIDKFIKNQLCGIGKVAWSMIKFLLLFHGFCHFSLQVGERIPIKKIIITIYFLTGHSYYKTIRGKRETALRRANPRL
jgi:hypothetical protein